MLAYEDTGVGVAVVLLHAFPVHRGMWAGVRTAVGDDVRLITPDLPGFGQSPASAGEPSLDAYVDEVAALLDAIRVKKAVVGGLSMGGYVALAFARRHPGRLLGMILADTKASADAPAAADNRRRIASVLTQERSPRVLVEESLPNLLGATTKTARAEVVARVRSDVELVNPDAAAWAQLAMAARVDTFDVLRGLAAPVSVIVGDEDVITPPSDANAMVAATDGRAVLTVIPRAGHLSAVEDPAAFAAAVLAFAAPLP
jgi:pimeloyl-ACP methyl ester carboxylesterase